MRQYIALIHKEADSDYGVSFPDLPGLISAGRTLDEARNMGAEALALHLEGLAADGEAAPEPSSLEEIMKGAQNAV
jgi:predicted RNase H-like HicB family nuclease